MSNLHRAATAAKAGVVRFAGIRRFVTGILMMLLCWGSSLAVGEELGPPLTSPGEVPARAAARPVAAPRPEPAASGGSSTLRLVQEGWGQRRVAESREPSSGSTSLRWRSHQSEDTASRSNAFVPLEPANWRGRDGVESAVRRASYEEPAEASSDVFANPFGDEPSGSESGASDAGDRLSAPVPADLPPLDALQPPLNRGELESPSDPVDSIPAAEEPDVSAASPPASDPPPAMPAPPSSQAGAGRSRADAAASPGPALSQPAPPQPASAPPQPASAPPQPRSPSRPQASPPASTVPPASSGTPDPPRQFRSPQVRASDRAATSPPAPRTVAGQPVRPPRPALPSSDPPGGQSGDRIYNQRDCAQEEENCEAARDALRQTSIRQISLDITARFRPEAETREEEIEARQDQLRRMPDRVWRDRQGQQLAEGRVIDIHHRRIVVQEDDDSTQTIRLGELGDDELCFLAAYWRVPTDCTLEDETFMPRDWNPQIMTWKASALCHKPLYFEERQLERYGHTLGPFVQPALSGAHFFLNVAVLPYKMGINPPNECQYPLGYYRPGSCAPRLLPPVPISIRGGLMQASAVTGMAFMVP